MMEVKRFIESPEFPINLVNLHSSREKGPGRPPHWEMVFWWTRKPLIGARSIIAASLLPENINKNDFIRWMRLDSKKSPHRYNPRIPEKYRNLFQNSKLLDSFAGFGSIPLEALRLGVGEVYAVELLPTAYVFLKAVLEYPKKYGEELIKDIKKWGYWITKKLKEDPDIKELYDDAAVYIGTWEVKCPVCGRYTPLVGNWWLSRVKNGEYVYMKPKIEGNEVKIEIVEGKRKGVPEPNVMGRPQLAKCLLCKTEITTHNGEFYPKIALRDWNKKWEEYLEGRISLDELKNSLARPRILVKVYIEEKKLSFIPATEEDQEKLWIAAEKLRQIWGDPDIPIESIEPYCSSTYHTIVWGMNKFYNLFNPRQLLTLVKLVKLIRETSERVKKEKLQEGLNEMYAFKYAEAVITYLAIALVKYADFNSLATRWNSGWLKFEESLSVRGIAMMWNWCDSSPLSLFTGTWLKNLGNIIDNVSYLIFAIYNTPSRIKVLLDDASMLSKLSNNKFFDVIITDPPYRDDVPYAELSDFYYVWLKRAFMNEHSEPSFHKEAMKFNTQWESLAINEISHNQGRFNFFGIEESDYYTKLLGRSFKKFNEILNEDGLLVTYFAHSSPEAWIDLIKAGWEISGFRVTRAWSLATEFPDRITRRRKTALESSIVVVWRRKEKTQAELRDIYEKALENAEREFKLAVENNLSRADIFLATMIGALSVFTNYDRITDFGRVVGTERIVKEAYAIAVRVLSRSREKMRSPESLFYLTVKSLFRTYSRRGGQASLEPEPITLSSQDVIMLSYGILGSGTNWKFFKQKGLILETKKTNGAKVAKQKTFSLLEPLKDDIKALNELLGLKGVNPLKFEAKGRDITPVDALHILEFYALQGLFRFKEAYERLSRSHPEALSEALALARTIKEFNMDPEKSLCEKVVDYAEGV